MKHYFAKTLQITLPLIAAISVMLSMPAMARAIEVKRESCVRRTCFPIETDIGGKKFGLLGSGLFRYLIFDVYTAALYGPSEAQRSRVFDPSSPTELVIAYHRSITASQFGESADDRLQKQHDQLPESVRNNISLFHAAYRTVNEGDRYSLRYEPSVGTSLSLNGETLVTIPGSEFAQYYFGIWLHPNLPIDEALREKLFGKVNN